MKKIKLFLGLALLSSVAVTATSCVNNGTNGNSTSIIAEPSTSVVETPSASSSQGGSTAPVVPSTSQGESTAPVVPSTSQGGSTTPVVPSTSQSGSATPSASLPNGKDVSEIEPGSGEVETDGEVKILSCSGLNESAYLEYSKVTGASDYNIYLDGTKLDNNSYYTQTFDQYLRTDIFGLKKGNHKIKVVAVKNGSESNGTQTVASVDVTEFDRSGYAHFNYNEGVGAYNNDGTLKDNAIVLYVTDQNKNSVTLTYKGTTVSGIGNILNSVGEACGEAGHETECKKVSDGKTLYGKGNTNQGILLKLAQDNIPLVVRFIGCVSNSGLYAPGTFNADSISKIDGLTAYNAVDYGGSTGDNGHMARMKSAKNITFEGVGEEAIIDGWGFHLICETAHKDLAKNFEVRNLAFINTPEDAIGMEGQEEESSLTITASVERCWVHHNTFIAPKISSAAESDKSEGDGSCDFKRGRYFTCSYNYFEECHKTNLIGSSKSSVQFNLSYHHNIWYNCAARQPLARHANIHFYNNLIVGTTDTVSSLRAKCYMYSENNYYLGCSRPVEYKDESGTGACKSFGNILVGCFNNYDATVAKTREEQVNSECTDKNISYVNFDTNPELFYYDSVKKVSDCYLTSAVQARIDCLNYSGSQYRTSLNKCKVSSDSKITTTSSSATISDNTSLTIAKGKGILKVFTVTTPVTITISAESKAGYDTGYLLKMDGTLVLALSTTEKTAVLTNGEYVLVSSQAYTPTGKNDKETTIKTCTFEKYNSEELNQQLIDNYNSAVDAIPATIVYSNDCYIAIKSAMDIYNSLGDLKSSVSYDKVEQAYNSFKAAGVTSVEALINTIGSVTKDSGNAINTARTAYNLLMSRCSDAVVSNLQVLTQAEAAFESYALDACKDAINAIGTVTLDSKDAIEYAEGLYEQLDDSQKAQVTNYSTLTQARTTYDSLKNVQDVVESLQSASTVAECEEAYAEYNALSATEKSSVSSTTLSGFKVNYTVALINSISNPVVRADKSTIELARSLYDSLDSTYQSQVTNYSTLTAAEEAISGMSATQVEKSLSASNFNITGASTTAFDGKVYKDSSIVGISKAAYTDVSKVVLNATRYDGAVSFKVSYSLDGTAWTEAGTKQPKSNKKAEDLEFTISATGDLYIKIEIICTKDAKQGTISSIKVTCYE